MKRVFPVVGVVLVISTVMAQSPFPDVSPCHWATPAVLRIAGQPQVDEAQALTSNYLAENSLRQVFEGLRCDNLGWSAGFISGIPQGATPTGKLTRFTLEDLGSSLSGTSGEVSFLLTAVIGGESFTRQGTVALVYEGKRWRVRYESLAALELPVFP